MLKKMKKQARKKGDDEKMPPLEKKQRAILRRYKMENAEIKKLKGMPISNSIDIVQDFHAPFHFMSVEQVHILWSSGLVGVVNYWAAARY